MLFLQKNNQRLPFLILAFLFMGGAAFSVVAQQDTTDERFEVIGEIPADLIAQQEAAKKISINIDGATLRSEVSAGVQTVRGWDSKENKITTDPSMIRVKANLEEYAKAVVLNDPNIISLSLEENAISIKYQTTGKLLGFIGIRMVTTIDIAVGETDSEGASFGTMRMKFPWYHLLVKKSISSESVASEFAAQLQILNSVDDTQKVAQYLSIISTILKAK